MARLLEMLGTDDITEEDVEAVRREWHPMRELSMDKVIAEVIDEIRSEVTRRADAASRMRYGKTRACEFAYVCGLQEAADLLEKRTTKLAQHSADQFVAFWRSDDQPWRSSMVGNELNAADAESAEPSPGTAD